MSTRNENTNPKVPGATVLARIIIFGMVLGLAAYYLFDLLR
jgi:hypothetical protein